MEIQIEVCVVSEFLFITYSSEASFTTHEIQRKFLTPLIILRNRLVIGQMIRDGKMEHLATPSVQESACNKCEYQTTCASLIQ